MSNHSRKETVEGGKRKHEFERQLKNEGAAKTERTDNWDLFPVSHWICLISSPIPPSRGRLPKGKFGRPGVGSHLVLDDGIEGTIELTLRVIIVTTRLPSNRYV